MDPETEVVEQVVDPPAAPDPLATLQASFDELKSSFQEQTRTIEYWHDKATAAPQPKAAPAAEPAEAEDDVLDVITQGGKAFDAMMAKRGYVRQDQLNSTINARTTQLTKQAALVKAYPALGDTSSEFFRAVAEVYGPLVKGGMAETVAMEVAAEKTELAWLRSGKLETPVQIEAKAKATKETERQTRIRAQAGDRSARGTRPPEGEDEDLTPEQKRIAVAMLSDDETTPEQAVAKYKARAKQGVAMKGIQ